MLINRDAFVSFDVAAQYEYTLCHSLTVAQYQHGHLLNNKLLVCLNNIHKMWKMLTFYSELDLLQWKLV